MQYIIIDTQGFRDNNNKFILKEIAILSSNKEILHFIVKPSYGYHILNSKTKYTNNWLSKNHHGFKWSDGTTNFSDVINILKIYINNNMLIYVKGEEKKKWISKILKHNNIINLDEHDSTSLKVLKKQYDINFKRCNFQHEGFCSHQNVYLLTSLIELKF